ncbi:MAG: type I-E CRISPR-associated protein Cse1/CasA [Caldilineaceae bacterium]|nr:type I-E CRISPR-associated protein Cse1/CasA [Caldilineaceae bacterium]
MAAFNLIDEPWIPCTMLDGTQEHRGIQGVLVQAGSIKEIGGESPPVVAALHRLLLAVLHRNFDIADSGVWDRLWKGGRFDIEELNTYFKRWYGRFDLFDKEKPFYQVAGLAPTKGGPSHFLEDRSTLLTELVASNPVPELSPAESARWLLGLMSFDVGGWKKGRVPTKAAMLYRGAVVLARGDNLFQTLMLNLCHYAPREGEPWDFDPGKDIPAWERDVDTQPEERMPDGYIDLLTWQSRRIRLEPGKTLDGSTVLQNVVIMNGYSTPDHTLHGKETMVSFRHNRKAKGNQDPWPVVAFDENRALWRDSLALLQSVDDHVTQPETLRWLGDLASEGIIPHSRIIPVDVLGLRSNQAKVLFWRHERLSIPVVYLNDDALAERVQEALKLTETTEGLLKQALETMVRELLGIGAPPNRPAEKDRIQEFVRHLGAERTYWSRLEVPFKQLLAKLPEDRDEYGEYGEHSLAEWKTILRSSVMDAFKKSTSAMAQSARNFKAIAHAEGCLRRMTHRHLSIHQEIDEDEAEK